MTKNKNPYAMDHLSRSAEKLPQLHLAALQYLRSSFPKTLCPDLTPVSCHTIQKGKDSALIVIHSMEIKLSRHLLSANTV